MFDADGSGIWISGGISDLSITDFRTQNGATSQTGSNTVNFLRVPLPGLWALVKLLYSRKSRSLYVALWHQ